MNNPFFRLSASSRGAISPWLLAAAMGSLWGVQECFAGVALRGGCARFYSGALLTGLSLFYLAAAWRATSARLPLILLPALAAGFRIYAALILGKPIISGAVANPVFAFAMEALAFALIISLPFVAAKRSLVAGAGAGIAAAALGSLLFLPVGRVTGIPACVLPGTQIPLALWGLPVAMAAGAAAFPLGARLGERLSVWSAAPAPSSRWVLRGAAFACAFSFLLITFSHVG